MAFDRSRTNRHARCTDIVSLREQDQLCHASEKTLDVSVNS